MTDSLLSSYGPEAQAFPSHGERLFLEVTEDGFLLRVDFRFAPLRNRRHDRKRHGTSTQIQRFGAFGPFGVVRPHS